MTRRQWTEKDVAYLRQHGPHMSAEALGKEMVRSPKAIQRKCDKLGIRKDKARRAAASKELVRRAIATKSKKRPPRVAGGFAASVFSWRPQ